jgi:hypothetical protein
VSEFTSAGRALKPNAHLLQRWHFEELVHATLQTYFCAFSAWLDRQCALDIQSHLQLQVVKVSAVRLHTL